jgi:hypothetical protein
MITEFNISTTHTISTGNFESIKVGASVTYNVAECQGDEREIEAIRRGAQVMLKEILRETYAAQKRQKQETKVNA